MQEEEVQRSAMGGVVLHKVLSLLGRDHVDVAHLWHAHTHTHAQIDRSIA